MLQVAQGVGDGWGVSTGSDISLEWGDQGAGVASGGWPEGSCPLRNSGALIIGSNSAIRATGVELQEIPQLIIIYEIWLQPTSRRFLRELDEAPGENNLHYILQCLYVPASVTRVWTRKVRQVATECSRNDGSKTQYYIVILDQLQGRSGGWEQAPESWIRGLLTGILLMPNLQ